MRLFLFLIAVPLVAMPVTMYFNRAEIRGRFKYCYYSYGLEEAVYTIKSYQTCPLQINRDI